MATPEAPVSAGLDRLVRTGALTADPSQRQAATVLDRIAIELAAEPGLLQRLANRRPTVRGAYLVGDVGRGKTMLMDLFHDAVGERRKRRLHYHEFMDETHAAIAAFRASPRGGEAGADPVAAVVRPILANTRLLCLDEFQVQDITNAMLLARLFEKLFAGGVTLVATSNTPPRRLYEHGLNRQLFLPFIDLLEANAEIVSLEGGTDFRRLKFAGEEVFRFGTGDAVDAQMDGLWDRLTGGAPPAPATVSSLGRSIAVPAAAMGVARFAFADLCEKPLGARDYLRLAHAFDTVMIDAIPQFDRTMPSAARRFILLIDTLYDRGVRLAASFAAPIDALSREPATAADFARTASRLAEMRSDDYLAAPRRAEPTPVD